MKKYGIFLGYAPEQSITNQGLGRLLAFIISGAIEQNTLITLAYPKWYEKEFQELCKDHNIDRSKIETITTDYVPIALQIRNFLFKKKSKKEKDIDLKKEIFSIAYKIFLKWVGISNPFYFLLFTMLVLFSSFVLAPFGIVFFVFRTIKKLLKKLFLVFKLDSLFIVFNKPLKSLKNNLLAYDVYDAIKQKEFHRLISKINKNKDIESWLIPTIFWPEIESIKAKKVVVVPDIILYDFPVNFGSFMFERVNNNLKKVIKCADSFITYSDYVKENHLLNKFDIGNKKVSVIHHGFIDLSSYFKEQTSLEIIQKYQKKHLKNHPYLSNYDFENMKYIFYSSQIRPHKNFMNLLKSYKILLREKFVNIKLIVTANLYADNEARVFIEQNRLQNDIISLYDVPSDVLAALNAKATCSVNPTLFEGGFPFTFLEAYTVGTPSIMSNIPMTSELVENEELRKMMLFNPFSISDMVQKIECGINNRDTLFRMQNELYLKMKNRTWSSVANDYIKALEK